MNEILIHTGEAIWRWSLFNFQMKMCCSFVVRLFFKARLERLENLGMEGIPAFLEKLC